MTNDQIEELAQAICSELTDSTNGEWPVTERDRRLARAVAPIIDRWISEARGWQPIETAPKDGTWVLLRGRNSADYPMIPVVCRWARSVHGSGPVTWRDSYNDRDASILVRDVPLGSSADWQPLPAPPEKAHD